MKAFGVLLIIGGMLGVMVSGVFYYKTYNEETDVNRICKKYLEEMPKQIEPSDQPASVDNFWLDCARREKETNILENKLFKNPQELIYLNVSVAGLLIGFGLVKFSKSNNKNKKKNNTKK